jgi:23S rRNA pseudouridine2605 synthase
VTHLRAGRVPLNRALSKLGILSRSQATRAILDGRVRVDGRVVRDPARLAVPERVRLELDAEHRAAAAWRTLLFHKPRGVVTTRRDPEGRRTIYDVLGADGEGLIAIGRLDRATSGLLLLTTDTQLAHWIADPANAVPRVYLVTVRGRISDEQLDTLRAGVVSSHERLRPSALALRKGSQRESHLVVELRQGRNREVRRLFEAIDREVTRLKRVSVGALELGDVEPGRWRDVTRDELQVALPTAPLQRVRSAATERSRGAEAPPSAPLSRRSGR